ncbi:hypothetical protein LTR95_003780 [Oleoguttula sp. CCFEE 5521]
MVKAFCDVDLGIQTFFMNEKLLKGPKVDKHDMFKSMDARVERAAMQIKARSEKRQQRQLAPAERRLNQDKPLDLAVGVHLTLIKASTSKYFTHVLLTIASRDLVTSRFYSTWTEIFEISDARRMWQALDERIISLFPAQVFPSKPHRLTVFRSGALLQHTGAEVETLGTMFAVSGRLVTHAVVRVSEDKTFTGRILSSRGDDVRDRNALVTNARSEGVFHFLGEPTLADAWKQAVYVSQAQCVPYLSFIKLLIVGAGLGSEGTPDDTPAGASAAPAPETIRGTADPDRSIDIVQTTKRPAFVQPGPVVPTMLPQDLMDRLAPMWRDDALGLLPTCKWPVPTYLARCAADRALLHLKAFNPGAQLCASVTTAAGVSAMKTIDQNKLRSAKQKIAQQDKTLQSTTAAKTSTDVTNTDGLVFRPVHPELRDTLYYL